MRKYNDGGIKDAELDEWIIHDRAVRESGHDTSYFHFSTLPFWIIKANDMADTDLKAHAQTLQP